MRAAEPAIGYAPERVSPRIAILSLSLGAFAVGASEFMISGLLGAVAADLAVSVPTAGLLVSGYALGVAVGGPVITMLAGRLPAKVRLLLLVAIFVAGNLLCAVAPSYGVLLAGRLLGAFCHGAFFGTASVVAGTLVPIGQRARAVALITAGVMVANIVGVPCGTALGQALGWRAAFWVVSGVGVIAAIAMALCLPHNIGLMPIRFRSEIGVLLRPVVLLGFGLSFLLCFGLFAVFTYITPLLTLVSGAEVSQLPALLLLFGVGATLGVIGGGRLADLGLLTAVGITFGAQIAVYILILWLCPSLVAMHALMVLLGASTMSAVAPLKTLVLGAAFDAPGLASTLTSSTLNLGVAIGAAVGASLLDHGLGYAGLPWIGIASASIGLTIVWLERRR